MPKTAGKESVSLDVYFKNGGEHGEVLRDEYDHEKTKEHYNAAKKTAEAKRRREAESLPEGEEKRRRLLRPLPEYKGPESFKSIRSNKVHGENCPLGWKCRVCGGKFSATILNRYLHWDKSRAWCKECIEKSSLPAPPGMAGGPNLPDVAAGGLLPAGGGGDALGTSAGGGADGDETRPSEEWALVATEIPLRHCQGRDSARVRRMRHQRRRMR